MISLQFTLLKTNQVWPPVTHVCVITLKQKTVKSKISDLEEVQLIHLTHCTAIATRSSSYSAIYQ